MEEGFEAVHVGACHVGVVARQAVGKIQAEHAAHAVGTECDACGCGGSLKALHQLFGTRGQVFVEPGALDDFQRFQTGGDGDGVARQSAGLIHAAERGDGGHNVFAPTKRRQRHTAADHFAHGGQIGRDAVQRLRAAERDAKTRHHFVVNQHRAVFGSQIAQGFDEVFRRPHQIHIARKRLNDDTGDFAADLGKGFFELGDIVVFQHQRVLGEIGGHACGRRVAEGKQAAARFHQQAVGMAVVAALEFDDFVAAGKAARQTDSRHGGFRARADQTHLLDAGHQFGDCFGDHNLALGGRAERQPAQSRFAHGFNHFGMGVADDGRSP